MEGYRVTGATVVEVAGDEALITFPDGSRRQVAVPPEIDVRLGQRVRLVEFDDGSPSIFDWSQGREATVRKVYVRLRDEGVDVWRPVRGLHQVDDVYLILSEPVDARRRFQTAARDLSQLSLSSANPPACEWAGLWKRMEIQKKRSGRNASIRL